MKAYARVSTLLFVALLGVIMFHVEPVKAPDGEFPPGWLSGYTYRKKHLILGAANAGVGYQVKFRVYYGAGNDTGGNVYLNLKCKPDFSDVRFADAEGNVFPYWIQTRTSDYADIWVKVMVDLNFNNYIYIYYGKSDAQSASDFDATFIFGETWSSNVLNTSKWQVASGTVTIDPDQHYVYVANGLIRSTRTDIIFPAYFKIERAINDDPPLIAGSVASTYPGIGGFGISDRWPSTDNYGIIWIGARVYYDSTPPTGYYIGKAAGIGHNMDYSTSEKTNTYTQYSCSMTRNGTTYVLGSPANRVEAYTTSEPNRVYIGKSEGSINIKLWDFKVRKYVSPEPQHGEWYPEESVTITQAKLNVNVEPSFLSYVAFTLDYPANVLFAPWSGILSTGSHTLTILDTKIQVNATHVYGFKCWKKGGEIVSFDKSYTFQLQAGTTNVAMVFVAHNVSIVSDPEMYVRLEVDGWQVQTPTNIFRGTGYYNFRVLDTQLYYNATHILRFYGWYVDNVYIGGSDEVNIYISYNTRIKLAYRYAEIPAPPPMTFKAQIVELGTILAGTSRDFAITVIFDANSLSIQSVEFTAKAEWLQVLDPLPAYATKGVEAVGTATINCRLTLPQNVQGYYTIPFKITAKTSGDVTITTASYITFTATTTPTAVEAVSAQPTPIAAGYTETIIRIIGNPIILILLIALTIWLATYTIKKR